MNYQGKITDSAGAPLNDTLDIIFKIYIDPTTPVPLWTETHPAVKIEVEIIELKLASISPFPVDLFDNDELWLGVTIGPDLEISPRTQLLTVPYAFNAQGVDGDFLSTPSEIIISGRASIPPKLLLEDDVATPLVENVLQMSNVRIALIADRNVTSELTELRSDGLRIVNFDSTKTITFTPDTIKFESVSIDFVGTEANFISTSLDTAVRIDTAGIYLPGTEIRAVEPIASPQKGVSLKSGDILMFNKYAGTEIKIDGEEYLLMRESDSLEYVKIDTSGIDLKGGTGGGTVRLTADSLSSLSGSGDIRLGGGTLKFEPPGGDAGGRVIVKASRLLLMDDGGADSASVHRVSGLVLVLGASGTRAVYTAGGIQLTGPTARAYAANPDAFRLTRPSLIDAYVCDLDDASDLVYVDLDDDGVRDIRYQHTPSKELRLESGTGLLCTGPTSLNTCDVSGAATYGSTVDVSGTMTCTGSTSMNTCDVSGAATYGSTVDVSGTMTCTGHTSMNTCDVSGAATYASSVDVSGTLRCFSSTILNNCDVAGSATFGNPVEIGGPSGIPPGSFLHVNGDITATGVKFFVEDHPTDATKEIAYISLEGPEAGTYTRGSAQLKNGVAKIELPEDFHLVTNTEGLTAQITPRGPVQSMLYVESVTPTTLVVRASNKKDGDVKFDFMINGVRSGYEDHQVIRDKRSYSSTN